MLLLDALFPPRTQIRADRARIQLFPVVSRIRLDSVRLATHTSGAIVPESVFPMTGLTTVMPSPDFGRHSVSPASLRIISLAGSGSRSVSARASCFARSTAFQDVVSIYLNCSSGIRRAQRGTGTHVQGNTGVLAELFKYTNLERKASTTRLWKRNKTCTWGEMGAAVVGFGARKGLCFTTEAQGHRT